jgi:two-component system NtrC family sensor kinase
MCLEIAGLAALGLISFLLYRANPRPWLLRWNLAWVLYLLHLPASFQQSLWPDGWAARTGVAQVLVVGTYAGLVAAVALLAGRPRWEKPIWIGFGAIDLLAAGALAFGYRNIFDALRIVAMGLMVLTGGGLAWIYAQSRRSYGGWLLLASFPARFVHYHSLTYGPFHLFDTLTAFFMLVAGLLVTLEEARQERLWRIAALRFSAAMSAGGGAGEIEQLCADIAKISGASFVRLLQDDALDPAPNDVLQFPLTAGDHHLGRLVLSYPRSLPGPPMDPELLQGICDQIALTLRGSLLTAHLKRSHSEWMETVDSIRDFILVHDSDGRIERVNRPLAEAARHLASDLVGRLCREVLPGAGDSWQQCPFCEAPASGEEFNADFGGYFLISTSRSEATFSVLHVVRDVSARKAAEERYQYMFENVREGVFISTPEGHLVDCNEGLARMLGYTREELLHFHIPSKLWAHVDDRARQLEIMDRQGYLEDYEVKLLRKDGSELVGLETSFATRNSAGKVVNYQGFIVDATGRKRAEEELRRQNEILSEVNSLAHQMTHRLDRQEVLNTVVEEIRRLFHFDLVAVYLIDETTRYSTRTAAAGYRTELGQNLPPFMTTPGVIESLRRGGMRSLFPAGDLGTLAPEVLAVQRAEQVKSIYAMPLVGEHLLGVISFGNRHERVLSAAEENLLGAISRQVNNAISNTLLYEQSKKAYEDLRLAQEQLLQTQKLAAVGQLVSGVAHELNNPLAAIIGYSQLLATHVSPKGADYLEKLMRQAKRTQKIIQDLLTFSRQRKPERHLLDLNGVAEGALLLREFDLQASNLRVVRHLAPGLPPVMGDRHQLEQAFLNIINNACDAIMEAAGGGMLEVRSYRSGRHLVLEFIDDGVGMKEPNRVFEPFYTTKKVGMGTGLGLSICYGILKEHNGEIEAESRQPRGSIFRVKLPVAEEASVAGS